MLQSKNPSGHSEGFFLPKKRLRFPGDKGSRSFFSGLYFLYKKNGRLHFGKQPVKALHKVVGIFFDFLFGKLQQPVVKGISCVK